MKRAAAVICVLPGLMLYGIPRADARVHLRSALLVCNEHAVRSLADQRMLQWFKTKTPGNFEGIRAKFEVDIRAAVSTFHSGMTTECQGNASIAFLRSDGTLNGPAQFTVLFTVSAAPDGGPRVVLNEMSMLNGAQDLVELAFTEQNAERGTR